MQHVTVSGVLYIEREWLREYGFTSAVSDVQLSDEDETANHLSGHIWLSPQLKPHYTGRSIGLARL